MSMLGHLSAADKERLAARERRDKLALDAAWEAKRLAAKEKNAAVHGRRLRDPRDPSGSSGGATSRPASTRVIASPLPRVATLKRAKSASPRRTRRSIAREGDLVTASAVGTGDLAHGVYWPSAGRYMTVKDQGPPALHVELSPTKFRSRKTYGRSSDLLVRAFSTFDLSKTGQISREDFVVGLTHPGGAAKELAECNGHEMAELTAEVAHSIFQMADTDGDGLIDSREFARAWSSTGGFSRQGGASTVAPPPDSSPERPTRPTRTGKVGKVTLRATSYLEGGGDQQLGGGGVGGGACFVVPCKLRVRSGSEPGAHEIGTLPAGTKVHVQEQAGDEEAPLALVALAGLSNPLGWVRCGVDVESASRLETQHRVRSRSRAMVVVGDGESRAMSAARERRRSLANAADRESAAAAGEAGGKPRPEKLYKAAMFASLAANLTSAAVQQDELAASCRKGNFEVEVGTELAKKRAEGKRVEDLMREWDPNEDAEITKMEFRLIVRKHLKMEDADVATIDKLFDSLDEDHSESLDQSEMKVAFRHLQEKATRAKEEEKHFLARASSLRDRARQLEQVGDVTAELEHLESRVKSTSPQVTDDSPLPARIGAMLEKRNIKASELVRKWDPNGDGAIDRKVKRPYFESPLHPAR
jgi:Ca2+-binding EF-hand superfamily protein